MIEVDTVFYGPEMELQPIFHAIRRLRSMFRTRDPAPGFSLELFLIVPGSLGRADFDGVKLAVNSQRSQRVRLAVAVPDQVATSVTPEPELISLLAGAVSDLPARANWFPKSAYAEEILAAAEAVATGQPGIEPSQRIAATAPDVGHVAAVPTHWPEAALVEITTNLTDLDTGWLLELDQRLADVLAEHDLGIIDGNEMSGGELTWVFHTRDPEALVAQVLPVFGQSPGVKVQSVVVNDGDGPRALPV